MRRGSNFLRTSLSVNSADRRVTAQGDAAATIRTTSVFCPARRASLPARAEFVLMPLLPTTPMLPPSPLASLDSSIRPMMEERFHSTIPPSEIVTKEDLSSSSLSSTLWLRAASTMVSISSPARPTPTDATRASVLRSAWQPAL